ncbi:MAG TPA: hypothetical protein VIV10_13895 [Gemmatimonadales bacterium]
MRYLAIICGVLVLPARASGQQVSAKPMRWAHVTYLTAASAYIDAGKAEGLRDNSRVEVVRGDSTVAILAVTFLATHQAACDVSGIAAPLVVGDSVRFAPAAPEPDSTTTLTRRPVPEGAAPSRPRGGGVLRGRAGLYYLLIQSQDGSGARFTQPSGDLRLFGGGLGGTGLGIAVDARGRRTVQTRADGFGTDAQAQARVYQASLSWQAPASPLRLTAGRQYAPGIAPVGLLDGVSAQLDRAKWGGGLFAGSEPDPIDLALSGTVTQLGGYLQRHSRPGAGARWGLSAGLSGSYLHSGTNREFLYLQGDYSTRRISLYAAQEVDYYRPWRRVAGEHALSPTSTFASLVYRLNDAVSVTAGLDNRRNVRLYRDVVNPETVFDDAFRRGAWAGLAARTGRFQIGLDARASAGSSIGSAGSTTLSIGADRLTGWGLSLRSRSTRYSSAAAGRRGWLQAFTVGMEPGGRGSVQVAGGWRNERSDVAGATATVRWVSSDLDYTLARSWLFVLSAYREQGGPEAHDLLYGGLSFRF